MKAVDSRQQEITNILKKVYDEFPDKRQSNRVFKLCP